MKNLKIYPMVLSCVLSVGLLSCGKSNRTSETRDTVATNDTHEARVDDEFMLAAADGGLLEVELGKLASSIGTAAEVKELGQMMVTDHTKLNDQLALLAQKRNVTLPTTLSPKSQEKYSIMSKKSGVDFDKEYASLMSAAHQEDISAFRKEAEKGKDADLKSWAEGEIPLLEHHLEMANMAQHPPINK